MESDACIHLVPPGACGGERGRRPATPWWFGDCRGCARPAVARVNLSFPTWGPVLLPPCVCGVWLVRVSPRVTEGWGSSVETLDALFSRRGDGGVVPLSLSVPLWRALRLGG